MEHQKKYCIVDGFVERIIDYKHVLPTLISATTELTNSPSVSMKRERVLLGTDTEIYETQIEATKALIKELHESIVFHERVLKKLEENK